MVSSSDNLKHKLFTNIKLDTDMRGNMENHSIFTLQLMGGGAGGGKVGKFKKNLN